MSAKKLQVLHEPDDEDREPDDLRGTPANTRRAAAVRALLQDLMRRCLSKGFYGQLTLQVQIQDGTIQSFEEEVQRTYRD